MFAHAVVRKGIDEKRYAVDCIVRDVLWLGYAEVLLKSDNEPAIVKLLKESLASLKISGLDRVREEHSPPYDSQANGAVESAVKQIKGRLRTMKLCLERRIGKRVPPKHPIVAWLVDHCAALLRFRMRGSDGKTPYERIRLRPYNGRLMCFAEKIRYKHRAKEPIEDDHRFHQGIFLGIDQLTGQYVVFDPDLSAVRMSRTVKLLPDEVKWNANNIESVKVTPYDEFVAQDPGVIFQDRLANPDEQDPPRKQHARKMYLKAEDFKTGQLSSV